MLIKSIQFNLKKMLTIDNDIEIKNNIMNSYKNYINLYFEDCNKYSKLYYDNLISYDKFIDYKKNY